MNINEMIADIWELVEPLFYGALITIAIVGIISIIIMIIFRKKK